MEIFKCILLAFLVICAIAVSLSKNLLNSILIYMSYSLIMSIIWMLYESPDLAITEAAVGAGVTTILFFVTLKKIQAVVITKRNRNVTECDVEGQVIDSSNVSDINTVDVKGVIKDTNN